MRWPWSALLVVSLCGVGAVAFGAVELVLAALLTPIAWLRDRVVRASPLQRVASSVRTMLDQARLAEGAWVAAWVRLGIGFGKGPQVAAIADEDPRPRALVLLPRPARSGRDGSWVVLERLQQLRRAWSIDAVVLVESADDRQPRELAELCNSVQALSRSSGGGRSPRGVAAPHRLVRDYSSPRLRRQLACAIATRSADVVLVEYAEMAYVARGLLQRLPAVYVCHESLLSAACEDFAAGHDGALVEGIGRAACFEARVLRESASCVALSGHDADVLSRALRMARPSVVPSSITVAADVQANPGYEPLALFVGSFAHEPNLAAVDWLLRAIWPEVVAALPGARLAVVGRGAERLRPEPLPASVVHFGPSDDLDAWLARAAVVVAPLRGGAGLRGKLLEAWARGKAVVATPLAARGFDVEHGMHCLLADSAAEFAAAIRTCLQDEQLRRRLGEHGLAYARSNHDPVLLAARFTEQITGARVHAQTRDGVA